MKKFCEIYKFKNLLDKSTCYKNPTKPSCVDLIIKNKPRSFQNSCTFETGLSDFHKMTLTRKRFSKKILDTRKVTIGLSVFYQIYLKSLKMFFMTKFLLLLKTFYLNIKLVSRKASIRKVVSL